MASKTRGLVALSLALWPLAPLADTASGYDTILTVDQGWDEIARNTFYHAPQGSPIMPYAFFLALEQADSETLFRDEAHLRALGMLYWGASELNPDGLPIGLTVDRGLHGVEPKLGMNCAACHVTEIKVGEQTALIDGGVSHFDFGRFMERLLAALQTTYSDDAKFERFAQRVLGNDVGPEAKDQLRARLRGVMRHREDWAFRNQFTVAPGPGRVDALNVILNQTTAGMLDRPDNARAVDAPVSFPFLWDAPYLESVQYNGVVPNAGAGALGRNIGQVLGVFGEVDIHGSTLPGGYASSVRVDHLNDLEDTLRTLTSPSWETFAEQGILPPIDANLAAQGEAIYARDCASCHVEIDPQNQGDLASIAVPVFGLDEIGTDPQAALGFAARDVAAGPLEERASAFVSGDPMCHHVHGNTVLAHLTVGVMMHDLGASYKPILSAIEEQTVTGVRGELHSIAQRVKSLFTGRSSRTEEKRVETDQQLIARMDAAGASEDEIVAALKARSQDTTALYNLLVEDGLSYHGDDLACLETLQTAQYRARPLNGIWATGPYLHNGSVPTLADLLKAPDERPDRFRVGDSRLDPVAVGFVEPEGEAGFVIDTTITGNLNSGHVYGTDLSDAEKAALLEYLKSL